MPRIHSPAARIIGERIRDARRGEGLSMDDLSALAEVSLTSVGKIERGAQSPSAETLVRLATALEIDPGSLVSGLTTSDFGQRSRPYTVRDFMREQRAKEAENASDDTTTPGDTRGPSDPGENPPPGSGRPDAP